MKHLLATKQNTNQFICLMELMINMKLRFNVTMELNSKFYSPFEGVKYLKKSQTVENKYRNIHINRQRI